MTRKRRRCAWNFVIFDGYKEGKIVFSEWILAGVGFGFKAFFAVLVFLVILLAVAGLFGTLIAIAKGGDDDDLHRDRPRK